MRPISVVNRRTNEKQYGTKEQNEDVVPRNNQYLGSSVAMVLSGPGLLMMLKLILYNHSSFKKYQQVPPYDPIPRKLTLGSLTARGYVHRLINHGERQYSNGKGNHINGLEGFWGYLKRSSHLKEVFVERLPLPLGEYRWKYNHKNESDTVKLKRIIKTREREV
jgi:hypothetical protein